MSHSSASEALAVVTGTTSGIGQAVAERLLERGWQVVGIARRAAAIDHAGYEHVVADLSKPDGARAVLDPRLASRLASRPWHRVGLVNNAASAGLVGPTAQIAPGAFVDLLALNVVTPVWLMGRVAAEAPRGSTVRIVNVSSGAGVQAFPGLSAYAASKAALRMAGMVLAAEVEAGATAGEPLRDLAVLSYEPGTVDTPMQTATRAVPADIFPWVDLFHRFHAEGRLVAPARPAEEIVDFLEGAGPARFAERRYGRVE